MIITIVGTNEGVSVEIPDTMTIAAIERYVREITDWLS